MKPTLMTKMIFFSFTLIIGFMLGLSNATAQAPCFTLECSCNNAPSCTQAINFSSRVGNCDDVAIEVDAQLYINGVFTSSFMGVMNPADIFNFGTPFLGPPGDYNYVWSVTATDDAGNEASDECTGSCSIPLCDVGSAECGMAQQDAQDAVASGGPYKNLGQLVKTAAQAANPYLYDGTITEECHSCIVSQFARKVPIPEQESCGPLCPVYDLCVEGELGDPPNPTCDPCVASVCTADPFCCDTRWDEKCVREAFEICGISCPEAFCWADSCLMMAPAGCGCDPDCCIREDCCPDAGSECGISCPEECAHDLCEIGGAPLDPACDPCVELVCDAYSYCCDTEWNANCGAWAVYLCDIYCPEATCWATNCDSGQMAPAGCGCGEDCCARGDCCPDAESFCDVFCPECAHDLCLAGEPLDPACDPCVAAVCDIDDHCCDGGWDGICIDEAVEICDDFYCPALTCSWFSACDIGMAPAGCACDEDCCIRGDCCDDTSECGFVCAGPI